MKDGGVKRFDSALLTFIFVAVLIISLTVRLTELDGYLCHDSTWPLFDTFNFFTYVKLVLLLFLTFAVLLLFLYRRLKYGSGVRRDYVLICTAVILLSALISTFFNPVGLVSVWGFYTRTHGLMAYLAVFCFLYLVSNLHVSGKTIFRLMHTLNFFSILIVVIGCFQFVGIDIFKADWYKGIYLPASFRAEAVSSDLFRHSASSLFPHFNYYGAWCSMLFPLVSAFAVTSVKRANRILFFAGSAALFTGVLTSVSQGPLLTLCIGLVLLPVAFLNRNTVKCFVTLYAVCAGIAGVLFTFSESLTFREISEWISSKPVPSAGVLIFSGVAILLAGLFIFFRQPLIRHRQKSLRFVVIASFLIATTGFILFLNYGMENRKHLFTDRGYVWFHTFQLLKNHPLTGYGPDNFYYVFPQDNPDAHLYSGGQIFDKPHNMYLQTAMDTGLSGLAGFAGLMMISLLAMIRADRDGSETESVRKVYIRASLLVITAYLVQGVGNDNHLSIQPLLYTVFGVGMALSKSTIEIRRKKREADTVCF